MVPKNAPRSQERNRFFSAYFPSKTLLFLSPDNKKPAAEFAYGRGLLDRLDPPDATGEVRADYSSQPARYSRWTYWLTSGRLVLTNSFASHSIR